MPLRFVASAALLVATVDSYTEPSALGPFVTQGEYFYVGGFKAGGNQDTYLVYPLAAGDGPFPFVSFAHGCCKQTANDTQHDYDAVIRHVASHGVVVAAFNTCLNFCRIGVFGDDQLHLIEALRDNTSLHPLLPRVNFSNLAVMGHSLGGGATITSAASGFPGIVAALAIHPAPAPLGHGAGNAKVPTFFMTGTNDTVVPSRSVKKQYQNTPSKLKGKSVYAQMTGAEHTEIQTPMPGGRWDFYIVQFLLCYLKQDQQGCDDIYGDGPNALCAAGLMAECDGPRVHGSLVV